MATFEYKLSMKLLIDTKAHKVLFAEAEKDSVDFLFHILSLPVATVTRLLKKNRMNCGCSLANLYESVENLNATYIQSNQRKDILLKPKSSVGVSSVPFLLLNDVPTQRTFYACSYGCSSKYVADDSSALCPHCLNRMSKNLTYVAPPAMKGGAAATGGFVKEVVTYMVTDDLEVKPMSTISCITLLNKFNVKDVGVLQEQVVSVGTEEALIDAAESIFRVKISSDKCFHELYTDEEHNSISDVDLLSLIDSLTTLHGSDKI